jgi:hypothetical protein
MKNVLPTYYDPSKEFAKISTKTSTQPSKRDNWLRNEKPAKTTSKFKKTTIGKRVHAPTVKNNQCFALVTDNGGTKRQHDKTIPDDLLDQINNNPDIHDKPNFIYWLQEQYTKKHSLKSKGKTSYIDKNYYKVLDDKQQNNGINKPVKHRITTKTTNSNKTYKMPLLNSKRNEDINFEANISVVATSTNSNHQKENEWTTTNHKEIARERKATTEQVSFNYLPRTLINTKKTGHQMKSTNMVLPLMVKLIGDKNTTSKFKASRILAAVLSSMQHVYPDTYIGPIESDMNDSGKMIDDINDIPYEEGGLKQYMATPIHSKPNVFLGKVFLHTNHALQEYRNNGTFTEYLREENIVIDINDLDDINPTIIGYLENYIPRYETINIQTNRVKSLLPKHAPNIQLQYGNLWGKHGEKTRVVMVKCDENSADKLKELFEELNENKAITFFHWSDFLSCEPEQRTTIVKRINQWRAHHRSIIIPGFCDHEDNVPMLFNESNYIDNPLTNTSVTDYLKYMVKDGKGNNLFQHVYPPINGVREAIVQLHNFSQATSYVKVIHGELARNMDQEARQRVFQDPNQALLDASKRAWTPSTRVADIPPTYSKGTTEFNPKRTRTIETVTTRNTDSTYSSVTAGTLPTTTHTNLDSNTVMENYKNDFDQKLLLMQKTIDANNEMTNQRNNHLERKIDTTANETKRSLGLFKTEVEDQLSAVKKEMSEVKTDIHGYGETLIDVTAMLKNLNKKMDYNIEQNNQKNKAQKHKLEETEDEEKDENDITMSEAKQHAGTRVTRSQKNNQ